MYSPRFTAQSMGRQLVVVSWNQPKTAQELLRMEVEAASIAADVNLSGVVADVGSEEAAAAVAAAASDVGVVVDRPAGHGVVRGMTLLAAVVNTHFGTPISASLGWYIAALSAGFAVCQPLCRAAVGAPAFGSTPLGTAVAAVLVYCSWFLFSINFMFVTSAAFDFSRRRKAIECMGELVRFPGAAIPIAPSESSSAKAKAKGNAYASTNVLLDLKHPGTCLCWILVRRTMRQIGMCWSKRMNLYSIVFFVLALSLAFALQGLFYGGIPHRLSTAVSLAYVTVVVSILTSQAVLEASRVNDLSPEHRTLLRREAVALSALVTASDDAEAEKMRRSLDLLERTEALIQHEEELQSPVVVFGELPASAGAITATVGVLLSALLVALQRLFYLFETGHSYAGEQGQLIGPDF